MFKTSSGLHMSWTVTKVWQKCCSS